MSKIINVITILLTMMVLNWGLPDQLQSHSGWETLNYLICKTHCHCLWGGNWTMLLSNKWFCSKLFYRQWAAGSLWDKLSRKPCYSEWREIQQRGLEYHLLLYAWNLSEYQPSCVSHESCFLPICLIHCLNCNILNAKYFQERNICRRYL